MIINNLPELYDSTSYITATRDKWPEGVFVFGLNARVIENKDVESTLVFDAVVSKYLNIPWARYIDAMQGSIYLMRLGVFALGL